MPLRELQDTLPDEGTSFVFVSCTGSEGTRRQRHTDGGWLPHEQHFLLDAGNETTKYDVVQVFTRAPSVSKTQNPWHVLA